MKNGETEGVLMTNKVDRKFQEAARLFQAGAHDAACHGFEAVLKTQPKHADALFMLGVLAYFSGDDVQVKKLLNRALAVRPGDPRYTGFFGAYYKNVGQLDEAAKLFAQAIKAQPKRLELHRDLAQVELERGNAKQAVASFERALALHPQDDQSLTGLASALTASGRPDDAAVHLQTVLATHPDDALAVAALGAALMAQERPEEAEEQLLRATELDPDLAAPHGHLGELKLASGHREEGARYFARYAQLHNNLISIAQKYRTDKWGTHRYAQHYDRHFQPFRHRQVNVLEIGVGGYDNSSAGGASLRMWKEYFPQGSIFAIDIHDKSSVQEDRIQIFRGSQDDDGFLKKVAGKIGRLDLIVDDGSHMNQHVISSFLTLFPLLADDGIYVVEDTHTNYWPDYGGTSEEMNHEGQMLAFLKRLTDGLNHEECLLPGREPDYFDRHITSIHFYHNLVFIYKGLNEEGSSFVKNGVRVK